MISRNLLTELCNALPQLSDDVGQALAEMILEKIQQRNISFEDQVSSCSHQPKPDHHIKATWSSIHSHV